MLKFSVERFRFLVQCGFGLNESPTERRISGSCWKRRGLNRHISNLEFGLGVTRPMKYSTFILLIFLQFHNFVQIPLPRVIYLYYLTISVNLKRNCFNVFFSPLPKLHFSLIQSWWFLHVCGKDVRSPGMAAVVGLKYRKTQQTGSGSSLFKAYVRLW